MHAKIGVALAAMLVIYTSSQAMAESVALNDGAPLVVSQDVAARASLTPVAWRTSPRSTHSRLRQSRNAGLRTGEYAPWSSPQAPVSGHDPNWPADNYQYWHEACCM
jgi:hypothetical protein